MRHLSYAVRMTHSTTITIRVTEYRKKLLDHLAEEKQVSLSDLLRYSITASFALFEGKEPVEANEMCLRVKSEELLEQIKWERDVTAAVAAAMILEKPREKRIN